MVVFGGSCGWLCFLDDLWTLESADPTQPGAVTWTRQPPYSRDAAPEARAGHAAIWQRSQSRMLVFGGQVLTGAALLDDVWALSTPGYTWTQLAPAGSLGGPGGRRDMSAAMLRGELHVFGGWRGALVLGDFWRLSGNSSWSEMVTSGPAARRSAATSSGPNGRQLALFGGAGFQGRGGIESESDDLWLFSR
jgi:hypothetical protein